MGGIDGGNQHAGVGHLLGVAPITPHNAKYNGAQRLAYTGVILMGAGSLVTGLAIYKPTQLVWLTNHSKFS